MNWNTIINLLNFFQLRQINRSLSGMQPKHMPEVDLMPEEYVSGQIKGPPPQVEENPCSRIVSEDELDQMIADKAIAKMEEKFNKAT